MVFHHLIYVCDNYQSKRNLFLKYLTIQLNINNKQVDRTTKHIHMSYITFKTDDVVYVTNIGYGTLVDCGKFKTISLKNENAMRKNDSIIFDPDLFHLDSDSNKSKRESSPEAANQALQSELVDKLVKKTVSKGEQKQDEIKEQKQQQQQKVKQPTNNKQVNIVSVRMDNTRFMIYTPDTNIKKTVNIIVKPILVGKFDQVVITIQISKTIQSLKKLIFQRLEQPIASYYNIRLFSVSPIFSELSIQTKTIYQCAIRDCAKIVLQAKYAFSFEDVSSDSVQALALSNGSNTVTKSKNKKTESKVNESKSEQQKNPQLIKQIQELKNLGQKQILENLQKMLGQQQLKILVQAGDMLVPQSLAQQAKNIPNTQVDNNKNEEVLKQQQKKTQPDLKLQPQKSLDMENNSESPLGYLNLSYISCKVQFSSGRHYWEFKLDKGNVETDIWIGFSRQQDRKKNGMTMAYLPLGGKKYVNGQWSQYGFNAKPSDTIGVLLEFNKKLRATITFYKNTVSCGEFQANVQGVLIPTVGLGCDSQVTLDSRAQFPLDSFRALR